MSVAVLPLLSDLASDSPLAWATGIVGKATLVLALAALVVVGMRRNSASTRHVAWLATMVGLLGLPLLSRIVPKGELAVLPPIVAELATEPRTSEHGADAASQVAGLGAAAPDASRTVAPGTPPDGGPSTAIGGEPVGSSSESIVDSRTPGFGEASTDGAPSAALGRDGMASTPVAGAPAPLPLAELLLLVWLAGALLVLAPVVVGHLRVAALVRRARRSGQALRCFDQITALGLRRRVAVIATDEVTTPMATGLLRPVVLLPADAGAWTPSRRSHVLLHELAHVARRDCLSQLVARLALAVYWFHPLAWYGARRMLVERERACDDLVLRSGTDGPDYADSLLAVAREGRAPALTSAGAVMMARTSQLEGRLLAILDEGRRRTRLTRQRAGIAAAVTFLLVLPVAAVELTAQQEPARPDLAQSEQDALDERTIERLRALGYVQPEESPEGEDERTALEALRALGYVAAQEPSDAPTATLRVAADGSGDHVTIQAALDAAPDGARIEIAAGTYPESLRIGQPLQLRGAGVGETRIVSAADGQAALLVACSGTVEVRGVRLTGRGSNQEGRIGAGAVVQVSSGALVMDTCAIAGGPASGLIADGGSRVKLERCLVTGLWGDGIVLGAGVSAEVLACDVRNIYHYGVRVSGSAKASIEGCAISGTGWHGIRYDGGSPVIRSNRLFAHDRFGIYANGTTAAVVEDNLFEGNGMAGMIAWGKNGDTVARNTFVGNKRSGLEILETSNPKVRHNLFVRNDVGVTNSNVSDASPFVAKPQEIVFDRNLFWKNSAPTRFVHPGKVVDPERDSVLFFEHSNLVSDPEFAGPRTFTPAADSVAGREALGARGFPGEVVNAWATPQPEESPFVEADVMEATLAKAPSRPEAARVAEPWARDVMDISDLERKHRGLIRIRKALASSDPLESYAGLLAFLGSHQAMHNKSSFRGAILPLTDSPHGPVQASAYYALWNAGQQDGDLERLLATARKKAPGFGDSISHLLAMYGDNRIEGASAEVLLEWFRTEDTDLLRELMRGLWDVHVTPEIEARLVELAGSGQRALRKDAIYFALSTSPDKTNAVLDVLFEAAQEPSSSAGRALWGLGYGVPEANHSKVADFALRIFEARSDAGIRDEALNLLESYAGAVQLDALRRLAANELLSEGERSRIGALVERVAR